MVPRILLGFPQGFLMVLSGFSYHSLWVFLGFPQVVLWFLGFPQGFVRVLRVLCFLMVLSGFSYGSPRVLSFFYGSLWFSYGSLEIFMVLPRVS